MSKKITKASYERVDFNALDKLLSEYKAEEILIYGFGSYGKIIYDNHLWNKNIKILHFVDGDRSKQGETYCGISVISPEEVFAKFTDTPILISSLDFGDEIYDKLLAIGISENRLIKLPFKNVSCEIVNADEYYDKANELNYADTMPSNPLVTAFGFVYNQSPRLLRRAIESVLSQTYRNFIYRIIDHGSAGETTEIIREYADKDARIIVDRYENNVYFDNTDELALRLYNAFSCFNTEFFFQLDSDDYYDVGFLENALSVIEKNNADIVKVQTLGIDEKGERIQSSFRTPLKFTVACGQKQLRDMILTGWGYYGIWGALFRTKTFMRELKPEMCYLDYYVIINAIKQSNTVVLLDEVMHYQTQSHCNSISREARTNPKHTEWVAKAELYRTTILLEWLKHGVTADRYNNAIFNQSGLHWLCDHCHEFAETKSEEIIILIKRLLIILDEEPYRSIFMKTTSVNKQINEMFKYLKRRVL